jgi:hypothetical protein
MAGFFGKVLLAGLVLLSASSSAQAWWGWRWSGYPAYYSSAYYGPAYYYPPVYPVCTTVIPTPAPPTMAPAKKIAEKVPAGKTTEPPALGNIMKQGPTIIESRSKSGGYASANKERCKVGFWNLTGRDVTLKIDGQQQVLPKNRAVTLDLERAFAWQIDQGETVTERVPEEQPFHEVILRQ